MARFLQRSTFKPPSEASRWAWMALAGTWAWGSVVSAHGVLVSSGRATIESNRVVVKLVVSAEDFLHDPLIRVGADDVLPASELVAASGRYGDGLRRTLVLREETGRRLSCTGVVISERVRGEEPLSADELRGLRVSFTVEYALTSAPRLLTFQLIEGGPLPSRAAVMALLVTDEDGDVQRQVRVTSRGNAATLDLEWRGGTPMLSEPAGESIHPCVPWEQRGPGRFETVFAEVKARPGAITVLVTIPLPVLETWNAVPRKDPDFLTAAEGASISGDLSVLLEDAAELHAEAKDIEAVLKKVVFRPALAAPKGSEPEASGLGFWTARVEAELEFAVPDDAREPALEWRLFNATVLTATAALHGADGCNEVAITTYQPVLELGKL